MGKPKTQENEDDGNDGGDVSGVTCIGKGKGGKDKEPRRWNKG